MSKKTVKNHIIDAINSIAKAQEKLASEVEKQGKIISLHSEEIATLQEKVQEMRDNAIVAELKFSSGKEVAEKYKLSEGRISQIKQTNKKYNT